MKKSTSKIFTNANIPKVRKQGFFKKLVKTAFYDLTTKKEDKTNDE